MKKLTIVKKTLITATVVAFVLLLASCGVNQKPEDTKDVAEEQNDETFDNNKQEEDAQFLVNAAEISLEEIQLGQLAQQKGGTTAVKELGKMMEDVHTKSLNDLKVLANSKIITIPTSPTDDAKDAYETLNEKSGNDFDKAYADMMVNEHEDAIDVFEEASTESNDADIKNWATVSLANLRTHLNHSIDLQKKSDELYSEN
jgi:putative membrane protein